MYADVVVVGAGVTGLTAAHALERQGISVVVIEATGSVGGQIRTVPVAGAASDVGAEALHVGDPDLRTLLDELGLSDQLVPAADAPTWVLADGELHP
ncbi:MAG: FAD-dependent oxidoreductase, partial [Nitriliruptorales bacterium]|nr:FAD-dependent oxidoreductase [Nitriliruptorales bacterium]